MLEAIGRQVVLHAGRRHHGEKQVGRVVQEMVLRRRRRRHVRKPQNSRRILGQWVRRVGEVKEKYADIDNLLHGDRGIYAKINDYYFYCDGTNGWKLVTLNP